MSNMEVAKMVYHSGGRRVDARLVGMGNSELYDERAIAWASALSIGRKYARVVVVKRDCTKLLVKGVP